MKGGIADIVTRTADEAGRVGYVVLYFLGVPVGLLLVVWAFLGDNIFGPG